MSLWHDFMIHSGDVCHKWTHYFPVYERHFSKWKNQSLVFWEIGVGLGGSLKMWQRYFGPMAKIIGIDINGDCTRFDDGVITVRIGNQNDWQFLQEVICEFGIPDVVLDDGGHDQKDIMDTFNVVYDLMPKNSVYMIEDLHTSYWPKEDGSLWGDESVIEHMKRKIDLLNADHSQGRIVPDRFTKFTHSMCFYDSIVVLEKGDVFWKESLHRGG